MHCRLLRGTVTATRVSGRAHRCGRVPPYFLALPLFVWLSCPVTAQEASGLDEIVVTARKMEESLQDAPVAVTALTAGMLESRSVVTALDVTNQIPNVTGGKGYAGGSDGFFYIRGIGVNDYTAAFDSPVGIYLDGVYLGRTTGNTFDLVDIERVEVLRGPQGTLFGRNTSGGAISIVSQLPSGEFHARASITGGSREHIEGKVMIEGPLGSDALAGRITFLHKEQDGWVERLSDGAKLGDVNTNAVRAVVNWTPADTVSVLLAGDYSDSDNSPVPQLLGAINPAGFSPCPPFCIPAPAAWGAEISPEFDRTNASQPLRNDLEVYGISATLEWDAGLAQVKSITAYRNMDAISNGDFDGSRYAMYDLELPTEQDQFSEELQVSGTASGERLDWLAGLFYFSEEIDQTNRIGLGATGPGGVLFAPVLVPLFPGGPAILPVAPMVVDQPLPLDRRFRVASAQRILPEIESVALYASGTFHFTGRLAVNAGLRWSRDDRAQGYDFVVENSIPNHPLFPVGHTPVLQTSESEHWTSVDPRVGFDYRISDDVMLYMSYAEGFRSGGFASRPVAAPVGSFGPEKASTFELGLKSELFDRRLRLNAAAFSTDYSELQIQVLLGGFFDIKNAGEAEIEGMELELSARPLDGLDVNASLGYMDAEFEALNPEAVLAGVEPDNELPMTPEWTWTLGAQYEWVLGALGTLSARVDYQFTDDRFVYATNQPGAHLDARGLVNLRATWTSMHGHWRLSAFGLNVLDEEYLVWAEDARFTVPPLGPAIDFPGTPAEFGVTLEYDF
jgi:iron complex outermembrane receptor protein